MLVTAVYISNTMFFSILDSKTFAHSLFSRMQLIMLLYFRIMEQNSEDENQNNIHVELGQAVERYCSEITNFYFRCKHYLYLNST